MKTSEILIAAKALIDEPGKWTQGATARCQEGWLVYYSGDEAVCFCSLGALFRTLNRESVEDWETPEELLKESCDQPIGLFNDTHSHPEVMQMWDRAIELAKAEEEA